MTEPAPPPPARRRFGIGVLLLVALVSIAGAGSTGYLLARRSGPAACAPATKAQYQCPMHPTVVQDHPGECPICGMKLVETKSSGGGTKPSAERKIKFFRSPMNPSQTSPVPRKDDMGMDYVPVYEDETNAASSTMPGMAAVDIDPARQQLIGLKTATVTRGKIGGAWRTVGRVAFDEARVRTVNIKVPVYVEHVYVDFIGKPVSRGAALFSGYSPELLAAQDEYLASRQAQQAIATAGDGLGDGNEGMVTAARRKLELLDVPDPTIRRLEKTGKSERTMTFRSPIAGVVTKKDVVQGTKLDEGAMPYEIVDLSKVWVLADVYESDIGRVKVGMPAKLTVTAYPGRTFDGKVAFIDPILGAMTRTLKARLEFANKAGELKPEMFGEVTLEGIPREALKIPEDAVIDSGTEKVVFVASGDGKFQPRQIVLGDSDGSDVEVVSGLTAGEQVVVRANFLIDSESRLRASLAALSLPSPPIEDAGPR